MNLRNGRRKVHFWRGALAAGGACAAAWLLLQALTVDIDSYDGYDTLCNARFFAGLSPEYITTRFPLLAFLLAPVELIKQAWGWSPMDVRPDHLLTAGLHFFTLWAAWKGVARMAGRGPSCIIAFLMAVPNPLFVSYASFISHDLLPGALFLWMLVWADRFARAPRWQEGVGIFAAGLAALLLKPSHALLVAGAGAAVLVRCAAEKKRAAPVWGMLAITGTVGAGFILIMGMVLGCVAAYRDTPFLARAFEQVHGAFRSAHYVRPSEAFPWWLYIRNLPSAFGNAASALLLPGLFFSAVRQRRIPAPAIAFLLCWVGLHLIPAREVRYMAFLAPAAACLIAPVLRTLRKTSKPLLFLVVLLWGKDLATMARETARLQDSFYTRSEAKLFLSPLVGLATARPVGIITNQPMLSFVSPFPSLFTGDRFHGYFHLGMHHISLLNKGVEGPALLPPGISRIEQLRPVFPAGRIFVLANRVLVNERGRKEEEPLQQSISLVEAHPVRRKGMSLLPMKGGADAGSLLHPVVTFNGKEWAEVGVGKEGGLTVAGPGTPVGSEGVVQGFRVLSRSDRPAGP